MDKKSFLESLGQTIIRLRTAKGWSQSDLARACLKDRQSIERLENGKVNPSAFYLKEVADALEQPVSRLFQVE
ncbi:helix-turn-helix transcriptional regulator [Larkinella soli]|uniref:helix-turn-helix transcriptional regulator n=1 Tax=Larkinella soli TaxID=1770527 RepID=UPI000FFC9D26|nr:helix-turn-helix transcriptional regulator [Larkinella soli]